MRGILVTDKELFNRVFALIVHSTLMSSQWLAHFLDGELDKQGELRDKIFAIFLGGLVDSIREPENRIRGLEREAKKLESPAPLYYLDCMRGLLLLATDLVALYSRAEMVLISEHRNQLVHTVLDETHKSKRRVRWVQNGKLIDEKIPADAYWTDWRETVAKHGGLHPALTSLRERLYNYKTLYWLIDGAFRNAKVLEIIQRDLLEGVGPNFIFLDNAQGVKDVAEVGGLNLFDLRKLGILTENSILDSVILRNYN